MRIPSSVPPSLGGNRGDNHPFIRSESGDALASHSFQPALPATEGIFGALSRPIMGIATLDGGRTRLIRWLLCEEGVSSGWERLVAGGERLILGRMSGRNAAKEPTSMSVSAFSAPDDQLMAG